jgi:hypothetical protein
MSVQYVAAASQKFTWPIVRLIDPEVTAATNVNSLPELRTPPDDTGLAPELIVKVVLVGTDADARATQPRSNTTSAEKRGGTTNLSVFRA